MLVDQSAFLAYEGWKKKFYLITYNMGKMSKWLQCNSACYFLYVISCCYKCQSSCSTYIEKGFGIFLVFEKRLGIHTYFPLGFSTSCFLRWLKTLHIIYHGYLNDRKNKMKYCKTKICPMSVLSPPVCHLPLKAVVARQQPMAALEHWHLHKNNVQ